MSVVQFNASRTVAAFMRSDAFVRCITGQIGSGKSTACLIEMVRRMCEQAPGPDGKRRSRWVVVRSTLSQIKQTVLKEFYTWVGPIARFKVSENTIYISFNDVEAEVHLIPLDDEQDVRRLLSLQLTGAWINECIEVDINIVAALSGRLGRYPSAAQGGPTWFGMLMDTNVGIEGSEWHTALVVDVAPDWVVFHQPSGLSGDAENLDNLPGGREYYERASRAQNEAWIKRYVRSEWGDDPSGTAVFKDSFKRSFHVVDDLEPVYASPLIIGQDFGRDPCSVICQLDSRGRLLVLEEVMAEDTGLMLHIQNNLRPALGHARYLGRQTAIIGDPAGVAKDSLYEVTSFDMLRSAGFSAFPAPTNDLEPRIQAVEKFLLEQRDGGPALAIDGGRCPNLIRALNGGYRFGKMKDGRRKPAPEKNEWSHVTDALQYAALAAQGGMSGMIATRLAMRKRVMRPREKVSALGWT